MLQILERGSGLTLIQLHPWCQQPSIVDFCKQEGILLQAHSALARNQKSENLGLLKLAKRYGASPAQVLLRYSQQNGCVPVVKATSMQHLRDNAEIERFKITPEDMKMMQSWDEGLGGSICTKMHKRLMTSTNFVIVPWLIEGYQE